MNDIQIMSFSPGGLVKYVISLPLTTVIPWDLLDLSLFKACPSLAKVNANDTLYYFRITKLCYDFVFLFYFLFILDTLIMISSIYNILYNATDVHH